MEPIVLVLPFYWDHGSVLWLVYGFYWTNVPLFGLPVSSIMVWRGWSQPEWETFKIQFSTGKPKERNWISRKSSTKQRHKD